MECSNEILVETKKEIYGLVATKKEEFIFPCFDKAEIQTGRILGSGDFGVVLEVTDIKLRKNMNIKLGKRDTMSTDEPSSSSSRDGCHNNPFLNLEMTSFQRYEDSSRRERAHDKQEDDLNDLYLEMYQTNIYNDSSRPKISSEEMRKRMSRTCLRGVDDDPRYALKRLRPKIKDRVGESSNALFTESKLLSVISHANIIKMRAIANLDPLDNGFFIVIDKLYDTLDKRLLQWQDKLKTLNKFALLRLGSKNTKVDKIDAINCLNDARSIAAFDLSSALAYLHCNHIIYRDLKPENIGFDVRDTLKLFDFNTSRIICDLRGDDDDDDDDDDRTYTLTICGNQRFMAPELLGGKPYNLKADVYSFAVMLWQITMLKTPFADLNEENHRNLILKNKYRPDLSKLQKKWNVPGLVELIQDAWSEDIRIRPSMSDMKTALADMFGFDYDRSDHLNDMSKKSFHITKGRISISTINSRSSSSDYLNQRGNR